MAQRGLLGYALSFNFCALYGNQMNSPVTGPEDQITIALIVMPRFPVLSLAICTESLRIANRELGRHLFVRQIVSLHGGKETSSSGIDIAADADLATVGDVQVAIVLSSYQPEEAVTPALLSWIRRQDRKGTLLGCVDTGAYALARAGVANGRHIATHREALPAYRELFGDAVVFDRLSALDGRIASSAGGMATIDMMARIIARCHDDALAARVLHVLNYRPQEDIRSRESSSVDGAIARLDRRLGRLVELMMAHIENPLPVETLSRIANVDPATTRRLFLRHFRQTPGKYYKEIRLQRAQNLLTNSALQIAQIATMTGFADQATFARAYRKWSGLQPSKSRRAGSGHWDTNP